MTLSVDINNILYLSRAAFRRCELNLFGWFLRREDFENIFEKKRLYGSIDSTDETICFFWPY